MFVYSVNFAVDRMVLRNGLNWLLDRLAIQLARPVKLCCCNMVMLSF